MGRYQEEQLQINRPLQNLLPRKAHQQNPSLYRLLRFAPATPELSSSVQPPSELPELELALEASR